jgi:group I intron endonuclease
VDKFINQISGVYKIICINNKFYIGSSININKRLKEHVGLLKNDRHKNKYLQNAWNRYGEQNFRFEIIETTHDISQLSIREKWWLNHTNCCNRKIGFNISSNPNYVGVGRGIDLVGQKFGRLTVEKRYGSTEDGHIKFLCLCDCGNKTISIGRDLRKGSTKSCGCLKKEIIIKTGKTNKKHGYKGTRTYNIWRDMLDRCNNKNNIGYKNYGGRTPPITVCNRWDRNKGGSFENFLKDVGEIPKGMVLGRINTRGGYSPKNCKLSTMKEQSRNKRNNKLYYYKNQWSCLSAIAEECNICLQTLHYRLKKMSIEEALTIPLKQRTTNE